MLKCDANVIVITNSSTAAKQPVACADGAQTLECVVADLTSDATLCGKSDAIVCDSQKRVTELYLNANHLTGTIPADIEKLVHLKSVFFFSSEHRWR